MKEVLNPQFLNMRRQTKDRVSCIFQSERTQERFSFAGHDIEKCSAIDDKNGNILEHSTLNMEWDSQGERHATISHSYNPVCTECFKGLNLQDEILQPRPKSIFCRKNLLLSPQLSSLGVAGGVCSHCSSMSSLVWDGQGEREVC